MSANARTERVAILLSQGWSIRGAAGKLGLNERTVRRWMQSDEFKGRVAELRKRITDRALGKLTGSMTAAVAELRKLLKSPDGRLRRDAAKIILEQQSRFAEVLDLAERIEALEAAIDH
jgi:hypothetical protein